MNEESSSDNTCAGSTGAMLIPEEEEIWWDRVDGKGIEVKNTGV